MAPRTRRQTMALLDASQHEPQQKTKREDIDTWALPQQKTQQKIKREEVDTFSFPEDGTQQEAKFEEFKREVDSEGIDIPFVQAVVGHSYDRGRVLFITKWRGDKEDSLETQDYLKKHAPQELQKYFDKRSAYRIYHPRNIFVFPLGSWDDDVKECVPWRNRQTGEFRVDVRWKTGQLSEHDLKTVYVKCPQKMLQSYEKIATFPKRAVTPSP